MGDSGPMTLVDVNPRVVHSLNGFKPLSRVAAVAQMDGMEFLVELLSLILTFVIHVALTLHSLTPEKTATPTSSNYLRIRVTERGPRC